MWIRSQDKQIIADFNIINIDPNKSMEGKTVIIGWNNNVLERGCDTSVILGKYGTEEEALMVMDQIEQCLITGVKRDDIINCRRIVKDFVFRMPKEVQHESR